MYREFYGLTERPFNLTPDTSFLYPSRAHREVLIHLLYGINSRCGFILVTGEVGAGKTTLCRVLLGQLDAKTKVAFVLNSSLSEFELLRAINEDFGLSTNGRTKMDLLNDLNKFLLEENRLGNNVVIIVDEAQNLSFGVLEQIRMLSNLETEKEKLLQIVLVGQPELRSKLASQRLRQLSQRITVRYHLTPLNREDMRNYVYYRLKIAGSRNDIVFTRSALDEIYYLTGGVPRLINGLCDRALMVGYVKGSRRITRAMICRAASEATGRRNLFSGWRSFFSKRMSLPRVAMALLLTVPFSAVAFLALSRTAVDRYGQQAERRLALARTGGAPRLTPPVQPVERATVQPGPPRETTRQPVETGPVPEGASSIIAAIRDNGVGSALGSPLGSARATTPLRTEFAKPDIDFRAPAGNYTAATIAEASYSSPVEPLVQLLLHWKVEPAAAARVRAEWLGRSEIDIDAVVAACHMGGARVGCSFDELIALNLPAVLEIQHGGSGPHYISLFSTAGDTATIYVRSKQAIVPLDSVRELYAGTAVFVTADRFVNKTRLTGETGLSLDVRKLQDYLKELKYFDGNPTGWYTDDTLAAVRGFQVDSKLTPTGEADAATKLRLYALAKVGDIPRLKR
ncbi:MAG: AAA family ATPase [Verrucomicrobia bacterium]|nr:AAA family ATPase [Verrucomicrobiota bacterium]